MTIRNSFDELLCNILPNYEPRDEQLKMSAAIADALRNEEHLIVEAGTGVGKSLAYLIPLAEWVLDDAEGQKRAVVSTYTKALQRQLVEKDLPFLRDNIFGGLRFALCIGSENYICLRRLGQVKGHGLFDIDDTAHINILLKWARQTAAGVRAEIDVPQSLWQKVSRESDLCYGKDCKKYRDCFYQKAKQAERGSHILVTNHHLFFAHVASGWSVLPSFNAVIFDEAHEIEDVAADYLGVEISNFKLSRLLDSILSPQGKGLLTRLKWLTQDKFSEINIFINKVRLQGNALFQELSERLKNSSTLRIRKRGFIKNNLTESLHELSEALQMLQEMSRDEDEQKEISAFVSRIEAFGMSLHSIIEQEIENHVYWAEKEGRALRLTATPVDIASIFKTQVFDNTGSAVLTSATLAANNNFDYIKERLGLLEAKTLLLSSPFNYGKQAQLYAPEDISEPNSEKFEKDLISRITEILSVMMGRTLVLFTSYSLLSKAANAIDTPDIEILRQGDMDSYRLITEFRKNKNSVLFGTYTFWQGIDIPGDDLQCVIITRLPFDVPDAPVIEARMEALTREGKNPFHHYQIPRAIILLKQGFGRLIRTKTDKGIVVILDSRIRTRGYGLQFLKSLPACKKASSVSDIKKFMVNKDKTAGHTDITWNEAEPQSAQR